MIASRPLATRKSFFINNAKIGRNKCRKHVILQSNKELRGLLWDMDAWAIAGPGPEGVAFVSLDFIEPEKEYTLLYKSDDDSATPNRSKVFKASANNAAVSEIIRLGYTSAELVYPAKDVVLHAGWATEWTTEVKCEPCGIISTDTHLFVLEARLHAKVNRTNLYFSCF